MFLVSKFRARGEPVVWNARSTLTWRKFWPAEPLQRDPV